MILDFFSGVLRLGRHLYSNCDYVLTFASTKVGGCNKDRLSIQEKGLGDKELLIQPEGVQLRPNVSIRKISESNI